MLSVSAAEGHNAGACRQMLELLAILSPSGVPRTILHRAAEFVSSKEFSELSSLPTVRAAEIDGSLQLLTRFSLTTWDRKKASVSLPRLIARVILERANRDNTLRAMAEDIATFLCDALSFASKAAIEERFLALDELLTQSLACIQNLSPFYESLSDTTKERLGFLKSCKLVFDLRRTHERARYLADSGYFEEASELLEEAILDFGGESPLNLPERNLRNSEQGLRDSAQKLKLSDVMMRNHAALIIESRRALQDKESQLTRAALRIEQDLLSLADSFRGLADSFELIAEHSNRTADGQRHLVANLKDEIYSDLDCFRRRVEYKRRHPWKSWWQYRYSSTKRLMSPRCGR